MDTTAIAQLRDSLRIVYRWFTDSLPNCKLEPCKRRFDRTISRSAYKTQDWIGLFAGLAHSSSSLGVTERVGFHISNLSRPRSAAICSSISRERLLPFTTNDTAAADFPRSWAICTCVMFRRLSSFLIRVEVILRLTHTICFFVPLALDGRGKPTRTFKGPPQEPIVCFAKAPFIKSFFVNFSLIGEISR